VITMLLKLIEPWKENNLKKTNQKENKNTTGWLDFEVNLDN